jgi:hypothetical protein
MAVDENAMRLLMLQSVTEQLWAMVIAGGRDRGEAMAVVERIADAGRTMLETTPAGPPELTHQIAAMQDEFWASVRQRVAAMCEAET